jgi:ABC-type dipeptide/oligopeptide/nickel transport system permease subunit
MRHTSGARSLMRDVGRQMRPANPRQREVIARMAETYFLQSVISAVAAPAWLMHFPLFTFGHRESMTILGCLVLVPLAFTFMGGIYGLVEGTADHGVRRRVRRGSIVAWILAALALPSSLVVMLKSQLEARGFWVAMLVLGVVALVAYFRQTKKYWIYVQSVAQQPHAAIREP